MSSFRDEAYEKLDYLSQLTEVVLGPQNELMAKIPDRIEISLQDILNKAETSYGPQGAFELRLRSFLLQYTNHAEHRLIQDVVDNFEFQYSDDVEIDLENRKMTGTIAIVKKVKQIDEKQMLELAVASAVQQLDRYKWPNKRLKERTITVLNTLEHNSGTEWAQKLDGRVAWQAADAVSNKINEVILENKWRVRDAAVITKIGQWIQMYMADLPDNTGLVNLIKLKFMLDKDLPVYSITEVKNVDPA